jgi:hypothetical protein
LEVCFCDLEKAIDCVNHDILLSKLKFYGVIGKAYSLIKSYLQDRHKSVILKDNYSNYTTYSNWGKIQQGVPQGSILGPLLFLLYNNDFPQITNSNSKIVLFADDTSIIVTNPNQLDFKNDINKVFNYINKWFKANLLSLNIDKTYFMQFSTTNSYVTDLNITYNNNKIYKISNMKFLGLQIDNILSWKNHVDIIVPKSSAACFAIRAVRPFMSQETLKMIHHAYFHSIITYGIVFWGNSSYSNNVFKLQKRVVRIIMGTRTRDSCREYFRSLKFLLLYSQYILSLVLFIITNKNQFAVTSEIHNINTRNKSHIHQPLSLLTSYQKGTYYFGIKVFSCLPNHIKTLSHNMKQFKSALKSFL